MLANKKALVHGDVSPKNILSSAPWPGALAALAGLNHFLLKGARAPGSSPRCWPATWPSR